jgi:hypothetical protein
VIPNKHRKAKKFNKTKRHIANYKMNTKPKHQNKTATPLHLTKTPVHPNTKPRNRQTRKATDAQQQQHTHAKQKTLKIKKKKTDMRRKEEAAVKGEAATGPSWQFFQRIYPHMPL